VFLTSRDIPPIRAVFKNSNPRNLSLLDPGFHDETKKDVVIVLRKMFETIKDNRDVLDDTWPDPSILESLLTFATDPQPLFIYVSTLGRFMADDSENPKDQLKLWLEQDTNASQLSDPEMSESRHVGLKTQHCHNTALAPPQQCHGIMKGACLDFGPDIWHTLPPT
jgi:hypothetical protein